MEPLQARLVDGVMLGDVRVVVARVGQVSGSERVVMFDIDGGLADLSAFTHLLTGDSDGSRRRAWQRFFDNVGQAAVIDGSRSGGGGGRSGIGGCLFHDPARLPTRSRPGYGSGITDFHPVARCCAALAMMSDRRSRSRPVTVGLSGRGCRHSSTTTRTPWTHYAPAGCGRMRSTSCRLRARELKTVLATGTLAAQTGNGTNRRRRQRNTPHHRQGQVAQSSP